MFDVKRLIKKSIQNHTLAADVFGFGLVASGYADKYLAGLVTMYRSYTWLHKRFAHLVGQCEQKEQRPAEKDYVWICWFDGIEKAPETVRLCYDSVCYWLRDREIVLITRENFLEYTGIPEYIIDKWNRGIIGNALFSDLIRLDLLIRHGGLWLDATVLLTDELPGYITDSDFFVYRNGWMDREMINMANWLIYSANTNNLLLLETQNLLYRYWKRYSYTKNYFLFHMFFRMISDRYQNVWKRIPYYNHLNNHLLIEALLEGLDDKRMEAIKSVTSVHKLTYKYDEILKKQGLLEYLVRSRPLT